MAVITRRFKSARHFADELRRFAKVNKELYDDTIKEIGQMTYWSIKNGSPITGAPGQPVKTGKLRSSWKLVWVNQYAFDIFSNVEYASIIEFNSRGAKLRSHVGGFHSVAITTMNYNLIIKYALQKAGALHKYP